MGPSIRMAPPASPPADLHAAPLRTLDYADRAPAEPPRRRRHTRPRADSEVTTIPSTSSTPTNVKTNPTRNPGTRYRHSTTCAPGPATIPRITSLTRTIGASWPSTCTLHPGAKLSFKTTKPRCGNCACNTTCALETSSTRRGRQRRPLRRTRPPTPPPPAPPAPPQPPAADRTADPPTTPAPPPHQTPPAPRPRQRPRRRTIITPHTRISAVIHHMQRTLRHFALFGLLRPRIRNHPSRTQHTRHLQHRRTQRVHRERHPVELFRFRDSPQAEHPHRGLRRVVSADVVAARTSAPSR